MTEASEVRPALARRYEFIEWRAFWLGRLNRKDIEDEFRVSTPQASVDLGRYMEICPNNLTYDSSEKTFIPEPGFMPQFLRISSSRLLLQLRAVLNGALKLSDTWFPMLPPTDSIQPIAREIDAGCLRIILAAIRHKREIDVEYQSLTNTRTRVIAPHALAFDGHRWHVRAFAPDKGDFRDFVLARIRRIGASRPSTVDSQADLEWQTMVTLELVAHPGLDDAQRSAIERDYGMTQGVLQVTTRLALAYYQIKRLNLDLPDCSVPPERKQIKLLNLALIEKEFAMVRQRLAARI